MAMEIMTAGPLTTIQDLGRKGYAAAGFQESGACDKYAVRLGNLLAGNSADAAVLEFTLKGSSIRFITPEVIVLTGADMQPELNGKPVSMFCPIAAGAGDVLTLGMAVQGLRGYLAVQGGIQVPVVMGSRSTNLKCGIGGLEGRALRDGDVLATASGGLNFADSVSGNRLERKKEISRRAARARQLLIGPEGEYLRRPSNPYRIMNQERVVMVRAVPGPQSEAFTESGKRVFERNFYRLTADSNRMACKLTGAAVETAAGSDMISDGIVEGSVQIASDGMPIVMLADHQTTGGYAKIGTVISTDIPALAQLKPGEQIAFKFVTPKEAVAVCRREARKLAWIKKYLEG